jgi:hypothetical protein
MSLTSLKASDFRKLKFMKTEFARIEPLHVNTLNTHENLIVSSHIQLVA